MATLTLAPLLLRRLCVLLAPLARILTAGWERQEMPWQLASSAARAAPRPADTAGSNLRSWLNSARLAAGRCHCSCRLRDIGATNKRFSSLAVVIDAATTVAVTHARPLPIFPTPVQMIQSLPLSSAHCATYLGPSSPSRLLWELLVAAPELSSLLKPEQPEPIWTTLGRAPGVVRAAMSRR